MATLAVVSLLAASCGGGQMAEVRVEPTGLDTELGSIDDQQAETDEPVTDSAQIETDASPASVGQPSNLSAGMEIQGFDVAYVPPITLPDLSVLSETGSIVKESLGGFAGPTSGLEVISAQCAADGGELVYNGSDEAGSFLDSDGLLQTEIEADGSGSYSFNPRDSKSNLTKIEINADGSGTYSSNRGPDPTVYITVNPDGSGTYESFKETAHTEIEVNADGSGTYNVNPRDSKSNLTKIEINADGSGTYSSNRGPDPTVNVTVNPDGSGTYKSNKDGWFETTFSTDIGILDPQLLIMGPEPVFAVADRFPPLAKLGSIRPPCVTIIRLDATVLFDFDSDQLRPEAAQVVENVAAALSANGKALEVHGHTDSKGDDDYNQDLSERRASSFAEALIAQDISAEVSTEGFGETRPVAPNETSDGDDDPVARQLNRRIEIVIPE